MEKPDKNEIESLIDFGNTSDAKKEPETAQESVPEKEEVLESDTVKTQADIAEDDYDVADEQSDDAEDDYDIAKAQSDDAEDDYNVAKAQSDDAETEDTDTEDEDREELADDYIYGEDFPYTEYDKKPVSRTKKIVKWSIIGVLVIAFIIVFTITDTGIIGAYKRNFAHNFNTLFGQWFEKREKDIPGEIPDAKEDKAEDNYKTVDTGADDNEEESVEYNIEYKSAAIIPYEYANESEYAPYRDGMVCAATNYLRYINSNGDTEWELATSVIDPILRTAGDYILLAQDGGKKISMYDKDKLVYDTDCEDKILTANLSENGDCVLVTAKDLYKGAIAAYNKNGQLIYAWASGTDSVIDAAISPKSRDIAVALLNTDDTVKSTVEIFDITRENARAQADFSDTILFDIEYFGNDISVFGDNSIAKVKSNGKIVYDLRFDDANLFHYTYDGDGNKLLLLDSGNVPTLIRFSESGAQKNTITVFEMPDFLGLYENRMLYNMGRDVIIGKTNGRALSKYTASMDIRNLVMLDKKKFFIVYSNSVELVKMK